MSKADAENMPDYSESSGNSVFIGRLSIPMPDGTVADCDQLPNVQISHVTSEHDPPAVMIILCDDTHGFFATVPPEHAREVAAGILRSAAAAEAGYGVRKQ